MFYTGMFSGSKKLYFLICLKSAGSGSLSPHFFHKQLKLDSPLPLTMQNVDGKFYQNYLLIVITVC